MSWYVLTHEYSDKSAFHVCGLTDIPAVVDAWLSAGGGECHAYKVTPNIIASTREGFATITET